ncbi:glycosyltransferase family 2 protein [Pseudotabrizicola algicola]|uniref:Glycosyltransferase family 2 protein n=1 Tax=Pseudotabrizicola algicola TaxID=2709381 RepID=A0A6B3RHE1_9RHOB|nr:glycosyltransferase family 2 protein [Pseudotabrizicola algicola]NEX44811.1 glycosyltransferase family 2 protein [Pseudotabrizicola algicola]
MKILAFTCVKNEGPFLLEWLAYNRLIGVTDFVVFSNDCEDGTDKLLTGLAEQGVLRHIPHRAPPDKSVQWQALQKVVKDDLTAGYDWAVFLDVDEFPMIHAGQHRLADAFAALPPNADALAMPWRLFGANGHVRFDDQPVTAQFLRSAPEDLFHPIAGRYIKTLYRPSRFQKPGVHRPKRRVADALPNWFDGAGQPLPPEFAARDGQIALPTLTTGRSLIELNHYSLRSVESFIVKTARGLANRRVKTIDLGYWVERNFNTVENSAITLWSAALAQEIAALRALPRIESLHQQSCDWHRARAASLIRTEEGYRLYCDCLHAADSAVLSRRLALHLYSVFAELRAQER